MSFLPLPFLFARPVAINSLSSLSKIQLFSDALQQLILARANFSIDSHQLSDFTDLMIDLPSSIGNSVSNRQAEYLAGRYLAYLAMQQSGLFLPAPPQIGIGLLRAPIWPKAITGSITHHQYSASAVVLTQPLSANSFVGIDTELWLTAHQAREISESIHSHYELHLLTSAGFTSAQATTLLFSAKEALFKAICPFVGEYFGFDSVELRECYEYPDNAAFAGRCGWLKLQITTNWVAARAPQKKYHCWFSCSDADVLTLTFSERVFNILCQRGHKSI